MIWRFLMSGGDAAAALGGTRRFPGGGGGTAVAWVGRHQGKDGKTRGLPDSEEGSCFRRDPKYHLPVTSQLQKWIWVGWVVFSQPCGSLGSGRG